MRWHSYLDPVRHLSSEPGGQSSWVRASEADPGVPVAQIEGLADVLVEYSQVSKPGWNPPPHKKWLCLTILTKVWKLSPDTYVTHIVDTGADIQTNVNGEIERQRHRWETRKNTLAFTHLPIYPKKMNEWGRERDSVRHIHIFNKVFKRHSRFSLECP